MKNNKYRNSKLSVLILSVYCFMGSVEILKASFVPKEPTVKTPVKGKHEGSTAGSEHTTGHEPGKPSKGQMNAAEKGKESGQTGSSGHTGSEPGSRPSEGQMNAVDNGSNKSSEYKNQTDSKSGSGTEQSGKSPVHLDDNAPNVMADDSISKNSSINLLESTIKTDSINPEKPAETVSAKPTLFKDAEQLKNTEINKINQDLAETMNAKFSYDSYDGFVRYYRNLEYRTPGQEKILQEEIKEANENPTKFARKTVDTLKKEAQKDPKKFARNMVDTIFNKADFREEYTINEIKQLKNECYEKAEKALNKILETDTNYTEAEQVANDCNITSPEILSNPEYLSTLDKIQVFITDTIFIVFISPILVIPATIFTSLEILMSPLTTYEYISMKNNVNKINSLSASKAKLVKDSSKMTQKEMDDIDRQMDYIDEQIDQIFKNIDKQVNNMATLLSRYLDQTTIQTIDTTNINTSKTSYTETTKKLFEL